MELYIKLLQFLAGIILYSFLLGLQRVTHLDHLVVQSLVNSA